MTITGLSSPKFCNNGGVGWGGLSGVVEGAVQINLKLVIGMLFMKKYIFIVKKKIGVTKQI